ncbi:TRAP transporter TatT component family protein [Candidatus Marinimicrobia bacterium]|nr:TRAP transporter TatT component family protein [Candidatus Neomarinimicrobiota bacterium]
MIKPIYCLTLVVQILLISCSPTRVMLKQESLVELFVDAKISNLQKKPFLSLEEKKDLLKLYNQYGFGILMESSDKVITKNYSKGIENYKKAYDNFVAAKILGIGILSLKYENFEELLINNKELNFEEEDIEDLYWLMAAYSGALSSSRADPFELINLPIIEKLLTTCFKIDPKWGSGALYSAMMSYCAIRPDLSEASKKDSINHYFNKALELSDNKDASLYVSYAELVHKPAQERNLFEKKLNFALTVKVSKNNIFYISNLIAQNRAKWLISDINEYFID